MNTTCSRSILAAQAPGTPLSMLSVKKVPQRLRLSLDCEAGRLTFSEALSHIHIHSLNFSPGLCMFPFVKTWDMARIVPAHVNMTVEKSKGSDLLRMLDKASNRRQSRVQEYEV